MTPGGELEPAASRRTVRALGAARCAWGLLLLGGAPGVVGVVAPGERDARAVLVARVLGVRELLQGVVTLAKPERPVARAGAGLDLAHASSAVALALLDRSRRRGALLSALVATGWAGLSLAVERTAAPAPNPLDQPIRVPGEV